MKEFLKKFRVYDLVIIAMMAAIGVAGVGVFALGMKYGDRMEQRLLRRLRDRRAEDRP